jgi:2-polyprenyl-3-methyl-5-hydroxy-6-metoxy-1,4-benzoquinol methylase
METINKQEIISDFWINLSKNIFTTDDKYNLTTFVEGKLKHEAELSFINDMNVITPDATVLDLACGNGRLCEAFSHSVKWMTGSDLCQDFIRYLNDWKTRAGRINVDFVTLDLLESDYFPYFTQQYSLIFLFGVTQCIVDDENIISILKNANKLLKPQGKILLKQTTSIIPEDVSVDHFSAEIKQHWIAKYRTQNTIKKFCHLAGLKVVNATSIYNENNLGEHYKNIERWNNTRQIIFEIEKE